jgi:hypothetical protein
MLPENYLQRIHETDVSGVGLGLKNELHGFNNMLKQNLEMNVIDFKVFSEDLKVAIADS